MTKRISINELRAISQPESVRGRANSEHWVADRYLRKYSPYLTRILIQLKFSPNAVTWLMILTGISAGLSLLIPGSLGIVLALLLGQLQMLWDCCDGEIARWQKRFSPTGIFLDKLGHYLTEGIIAVAIGLRLANWPNRSISESSYPLLGAVFAILVLLNKVLNDVVHISRYFSGLPKLEDSKSVSHSKIAIVNLAKVLFKFLPVHRMFHSVEMTIGIFLIMIFEKATGQSVLTEIFTWIVPVALFIFLGHLISILTSHKLSSQ